MMAASAFWRICLMSSSIPTTNMNMMIPTWLSIRNAPSDSAGKTNWKAPGKSARTTDGPRTMPASISPMTAGWRILTNNAPNIRAATTMRINWTSSRLSGSRKFTRKVSKREPDVFSGCAVTEGCAEAAMVVRPVSRRFPAWMTK